MDGAGSFLKQMNCPVCLELPAKAILQCKNGHIICSNCFHKLTHCPQCRVPLEITRNRALEVLLDMMKFDCEYKDKGCTEKLPRKDMLTHVEQCQFGGKSTKVCKLFGLPCQFAVNTRELPNAITHFIEQHKSTSVNSSCIEIHLNGFGNCRHRVTNIWAPIIMDWDLAKRSLFALVCTVTGKEPMFMITCVEIRDTDSESDYKVGFRVVCGSQEERDLVWISSPLQSQGSYEVFGDVRFQFPYQRLRENFAKDNTLVVKCFIAKNKNPEEISAIQDIAVVNTSIITGERGKALHRLTPLVLPTPQMLAASLRGAEACGAPAVLPEPNPDPMYFAPGVPKPKSKFRFF